MADGLTPCRYHCRKCGAHLTSLEAFDAHREGLAGSHRSCSWPELPAGYEWREHGDFCAISRPPERIEGVAVYSLVRPGVYAAEARETAQVGARTPS
jgi:hypothetical protein